MEDLNDTRQVEGYTHVRYYKDIYSESEILERSTKFYKWLDQRRTARDFSDRPIPQKVIDNIILAASTAPSGAHKQPWKFCVVSNPALKSKIREAAEKEEQESYQNRMNDEWLEALKPIGTDWHKPFLEIAPYLILVFKKSYELDKDGIKSSNYYVNESVGIATGFLLAAIHNAGLIALTHTPGPMNFLTKLLNRPSNERPYLLIPVGYPANEVYVPKLERKALEEVVEYYQ